MKHYCFDVTTMSLWKRNISGESSVHKHPRGYDITVNMDKGVINLPLIVTKMMTSAPASETSTVFPKQKTRIVSDVNHVRIYKRLIAKNRLFPDPAADVIYQNPTHPIKSIYVSKQKDCEELEITPKYTVDIPTCCKFHRKETFNTVKKYRKLLYNSPQPNRFPYRKTPSRLERVITKGFETNSKKQMPLSTVCVHWHNNKNFIGQPKDIRKKLASFGPISNVCMTSSETATVVFENLIDSCGVIDKQMIGSGDTRLYCHWLHKTLQATKFLSNGERFKAVHDEFIYPKI